MTGRLVSKVEIYHFYVLTHHTFSRLSGRENQYTQTGGSGEAALSVRTELSQFLLDEIFLQNLKGSVYLLN